MWNWLIKSNKTAHQQETSYPEAIKTDTDNYYVKNLEQENKELRELLSRALLGIELATIPHLIDKFGQPVTAVIVNWQERVRDRLKTISIRITNERS